MGLEELLVRLNDTEYKNWLKAGRCLVILRECLHLFSDHHMRIFHGNLLTHNNLLRYTCRTSCRPKGNKLPSLCRECSEWRKVILHHHRQPESCTINWDNCYPPYWRTEHWELAKAYMPRGQAKVQRADQCDVSALLNLICHCKSFWSVDVKLVRELIRFRNDLMHSSEFRVNDQWMSSFQTTLMAFVQKFNQEPGIGAARQRIDEMLTLDLSICVSGEDRMDSGGLMEGLETDTINQSQISLNSVSQWEAELLQELLQEALPTEAEDDEAKDTEQLRRLGVFLQANKDLGERFSAALQVINNLKE